MSLRQIQEHDDVVLPLAYAGRVAGMLQWAAAAGVVPVCSCMQKTCCFPKFSSFAAATVGAAMAVRDMMFFPAYS